MKRNRISELRNIGIMAHIDAGKTTLTERVLFYTGQQHFAGNVDDGNTRTDYLDEEKKRGITIQSAAVSAAWQLEGQPYSLNIIDTPGHMDFTVEVERSLRVLDGAVALFCAVGGVEAQSRTVWNQADRHAVPRIAFVNKMDRAGADFGKVLQAIRTELGAQAWPIQLPVGAEDNFQGIIDLVGMQMLTWRENGKGSETQSNAIPAEHLQDALAARQQLLEAMALSNEAFLDIFLERTPSEAEIWQTLRNLTLHASWVPVLAGSAFRHIGVQPLLDAVARLLPSPADRLQPEGLDADAEGPLAALAFKTLMDEFVGRLNFVRLYSGTLRPGQSVWLPRTGSKVRISRIFVVDGANRIEVDAAQAGDIVAVTGPRELLTGDTLCLEEHALVLESMEFPEPVIDLAVEALRPSDLDKLGLALSRMAQEDPSLRLRTDAESGQLILSGMGELHLEVVLERLQNATKLEIRTGKPRVGYRETITQVARHRERLKRQSGGPGQFAEVEIEVSPLESGEGFEFVNEVRGGVIPAEFISAVEKGARAAMREGLLSGSPMVGVKVRLLDGLTHANDSNAMAFEACGRKAMQEACAKASPVMLEPVMRVEVSAPESYTGMLISDLNRRRGIVGSIEHKGQLQVVTAHVPLAEMFGYVGTMRSLTSGTGAFAMEFASYAKVSAELVVA